MLLELLDGQQPTEPAAFDALCCWLKNCYAALRQSYGTEMILFDLHLRNFIWTGKKLYGVDFECVRPGKAESDVGLLLAFLATYTPAFTPEKLRLAAELYRKLTRELGLDAAIVQQETQSQLAMIAARRNTVFESSKIQCIFS